MTKELDHFENKEHMSEIKKKKNNVLEKSKKAIKIYIVA